MSTFRWSRTCTITEPKPAIAGTRVTQSYPILKFPRMVELATVVFNPSHRDRGDALRRNLARLGEISAGVRA